MKIIWTKSAVLNLNEVRNMIHKILQVLPTDDYKVYLYFSDGKVKLFDGKDIVKKGVFQELQDKVKFKNFCTVLNDTLAWDTTGKYNPSNCLDLDPEELYNSCPEVNEPTKLENMN